MCRIFVSPQNLLAIKRTRGLLLSKGLDCMQHVKFSIYHGFPSCLLEVSGEDAFSFLQSQCSQDLRRLSPTQAVYTFWLDRKGKVQADSFLLTDGSGIYWIYSYFCPASLLIEKLTRHLVADDVTITDLSGKRAEITLLGIPPGLLPLVPPLPPGTVFREGRTHTFLLGHRSLPVETQCDLLLPPELLEAEIVRWRKAGADHIDATERERERIRCGIPAVPWDLGPDDWPTQTTWHEQAVARHKGCYLGQEVIAHLDRKSGIRWKLFHLSCNQALEPSTPLFQGDRLLGKVRTSNGREAFAMLRFRELLPDRGLSRTVQGPLDVHWRPA